MDSDVKEFLEQQIRDYGKQAVEDNGLSYLAEVYPERLRQFMGECQFDYEVGSLPRKTLEAVLLASAFALRSSSGIPVHLQGCLSQGYTPREILDIMYAASAAAGHIVIVEALPIIKSMLEDKKK